MAVRFRVVGLWVRLWGGRQEWCVEYALGRVLFPGQ